RWTHWELLGVPWGATAAQAKAAYLEKAKAFHPDRYAGRRLGSFRARLERVFRRITEARDVLVDDAKREAYARETAPPEQRAKLELRRLEDERRAAERRARLARRNPLVARASRVGELVARGRQAFEDGRVAQAASDLQLAAGLDPGNAEVQALAADARKRATVRRAVELYEQGLAAELAGRRGAALAAFREALGADPRHVRAAAAAARVAIELGELDAARAHAEAAVRAGPDVAAAHEALGAVLDAQGAKKEARRALERALELDPRLEGAKERLKRLRWSFLG
ncbi:MAG: tetratricopeptide repeat protein, partial [Syntrophomonadaceae bacterium]